MIISMVLSADPPSTITISSAFLVWVKSESRSAPILPSSLNVVIQIEIFIHTFLPTELIVLGFTL